MKWRRWALDKHPWVSLEATDSINWVVACRLCNTEPERPYKDIWERQDAWDSWKHLDSKAKYASAFENVFWHVIWTLWNFYSSKIANRHILSLDWWSPISIWTTNELLLMLLRPFTRNLSTSTTVFIPSKRTLASSITSMNLILTSPSFVCLISSCRTSDVLNSCSQPALRFLVYWPSHRQSPLRFLRTFMNDFRQIKRLLILSLPTVTRVIGVSTWGGQIYTFYPLYLRNLGSIQITRLSNVRLTTAQNNSHWFNTSGKMDARCLVKDSTNLVHSCQPCNFHEAKTTRWGICFSRVGYTTLYAS